MCDSVGRAWLAVLCTVHCPRECSGNLHIVSSVPYTQDCWGRTVGLSKMFVLISNFRCVLNVVCFLLGDSPASDFYMPMFLSTVCSVFIGSESRKNNEDEIVGVFIWEKFWHERSLSHSEGG